jgi:hypothetical protein
MGSDVVVTADALKISRHKTRRGFDAVAVDTRRQNFWNIEVRL